ncbi:Thaumatin-like protein 1 [Sarracenia purpurea var. burkii]
MDQVRSTSFKIVNKCRHTIWPGILTGADRTVLTPTGFTLRSGQSRTLSVPKSWSGRLWGRSLCAQDSSGKFSCATGDCGSGKIACAGAGAIPPATLAEFTLNGDQGLDFYDVSLVDGTTFRCWWWRRGVQEGDAAPRGVWWTLTARALRN